MRFKNYLALVSFCCAFFSIGTSVYSLHWGKVTELFPHLKPTDADQPLAVVRSLNFALPLSACCILLLIRMRKVDGLGPFGITALLLANLAAADMTLRSKDAVFGRDVHLSRVAWWMPPQAAGEAAVLQGGPGVTVKAKMENE